MLRRILQRVLPSRWARMVSNPGRAIQREAEDQIVRQVRRRMR